MTTDLKELIERAKGIDGDFAEMNPCLTMQYVHALAERLEAELCAVVNPLVWGGDEKHSYAIGTLTGNSYSIGPSVVDDHLGDMRISGPWTGFRYASTMEKAQALAQSEETYRILSAITTRSASDVAAEARAGAIEAAARNIEASISKGVFVGKLPDHVRAIHDTDTLAAIERIKEQARKEERERCHNAIMGRDIEAYYREGGRIQFDDMQEFFAATVDAATTEDEQ